MLSRTATIQPAIDFVSYLNNFPILIYLIYLPNTWSLSYEMQYSMSFRNTGVIILTASLYTQFIAIGAHVS
eukprot:UN18924